MILEINTEKSVLMTRFVHTELPLLIKDEFKTSVDKKRLATFDFLFEDGSAYDAILLAINTLDITNTSSGYALAINKRIMYNNLELEQLIRIITYGSLDVSGYPILLDVFNYIADNIEDLYTEWRVEIGDPIL